MANGTYPVDLTSDIGKVRALIPDTAPVPLDVTGDFTLSDDLITAYLSLANGGVFLAAALALEAIAVDETLTYKIVSTDDLSINGVTGAQQLLARAKTLRTQQDTANQEGVSAFYITTPAVLNRTARRPEATPWPRW